jgi:hypothetical protein
MMPARRGPVRSGNQIRLPAKKSRCTRLRGPANMIEHGVQCFGHLGTGFRAGAAVPCIAGHHQSNSVPSAVSDIAVLPQAGRPEGGAARCIAIRASIAASNIVSALASVRIVENRASPRSSSSTRPLDSSAAMMRGDRQADVREMLGDAQERAHVLGRRRVHQHGAVQPQIPAKTRVLRQRSRIAEREAVGCQELFDDERRGPGSLTRWRFPRGGAAGRPRRSPDRRRGTERRRFS